MAIASGSGVTEEGAAGADAARYRLLYDLGCAFSSRIDLDELVPYVIRRCREILDASAVSVLLLDAESGELYFPYVSEEDPEAAARLAKLRFPADRGIAGAVLKSGKGVRVDDVQSDPRFYGGVDRDTGSTTRNAICAPLKTRQGALGVVQVINRHGGAPFTDEDLAFLEALAGSVAVAIENARLYARVKASEEVLRAQVGALRRDLARRDRFSDMIGSGPAMSEVFQLMESAAASPIAVLIEGETGTGKELVARGTIDGEERPVGARARRVDAARGIHAASTRADGPFLAVNCAAVSETLLESELFGHRRGAFTGATQDQRGLFEAAARGTIFLDEIGEMPHAMQAKMLRVVQEGEIIPVGDTQPRTIDVRIISATNRDLLAEVERQNFRRDLYYRLAAFPIRLPTLRERREDIALLIDRSLKRAAERHGKRVTGIEPGAVDLLTRFDWPGNIRELENEIERAVAIAPSGETIGAAHLSAKVRAPSTPNGVPGAVAAQPVPLPASSPSEPDLRRARADFEARFIQDALGRFGRNVTKTARALGISRVMLQKKMKEYGLR